MIKREQLEIGTILYAVQPCIMKTTGEKSLTIGKAYPITEFYRETPEEEEMLVIIDDQEDEHCFDFYDLHKYFTLNK
jgi:hypothetical protein